MPQRPCIAVIADIVGSRRFRGAQRGAVQRRFDALVRQLNQRFHGKLLAPFVISRGDEFQGLLRGAGILPDMIWNLELWFTTADVRVGIGYGTLETPPGSNVLQLDGPVLHRAREALDVAATTKRLGGVFRGFGEAGDPILNGIARLLHRQRERMSARQRGVLQHLREGSTQMAIAKKLGLTKQAISDHARAAGWEAYREGDIAWSTALDRFTAPGPAGRKP